MNFEGAAWAISIRQIGTDRMEPIEIRWVWQGDRTPADRHPDPDVLDIVTSKQLDLDSSKTWNHGTIDWLAADIEKEELMVQ